MKNLDLEFESIAREVQEEASRTILCRDLRQAWRIKTRFYVFRKGLPPDHPAHDLSLGIRKVEGGVKLEFYLSNDLAILQAAVEVSEKDYSQAPDAVLEAFFENIEKRKK